ncbi:MAG: MFS transporter [Chitinophagales bacterium]
MKNKKAIMYLLIANAVSGVSQGISLISITWFVSNTLGKPAFFGTMFLAATLFSIPWGTYAGTLVDKHDRKKIMLFIQSFGLILVLGTALAGFYLGRDALWMAMIVYFSTVVAYNIHYPNLYAFAQEITEKENYSKITSWIEIQGQTSFAIAGALGAILLEGKIMNFDFGKWSLHEIFLLDAVTYLVALLFLFLIKYESLAERDKSKANIFNRLKDGFVYLTSSPKILLFGVITGVIFAGSLVTGMYSLPILIKTFIGGTEKVYGFTEGAFALGALMSGIFIFSVFSKKNLVLGLLMLHITATVCFFFMGINQNVILLYIIYCIVGFTNAGTRILRVTYLFNVIPNKFIGRANSIFSVINASLRVILISIFSSAFFIEDDNIRYAMFILSALVFIGVLVLSFNFNIFRKLNQSAH